MNEPIRVLLIPSSDYLGHPFPQRYNHIFERLHGEDIEVHAVRFTLKPKPVLQSRVIIHELDIEFKCPTITQYYLANFINHNLEILRIIRKEKINTVVISNLSPCYLVTLLKSLLKTNITIIFDVQDYYPVSAAGYIASKNSILYTLSVSALNNIMRQLIQKSDSISAASRLLERLAQKLGAKRTYFIPNGIPEYFVNQYREEGIELRAKFGLGKSIVIGYVGSIEFWLDFEPVLRAIKQLIAEGVSIHLVLIGGKLHTEYENQLTQRIEELKLQDYVLKLGFIKHEKLPKYIAMFDFGLLPFDPMNPLNIFIEEPLKLWEYLSQRVIPLSTPLKGIIRYNMKFVCIYRNAKDIYNIVKKYQKDSKSFVRRAKEGQVFAVNNRTWDSIAYKFRKILYETIRSK